ncbi:MAG: DNA/RNA non-specific endonuclease [Lentisphaerae bacterium]|jgi:endonuclease G|nr:DNA/RNA non-specific endonuclease [Lentisphaerota bacterium]
MAARRRKTAASSRKTKTSSRRVPAMLLLLALAIAAAGIFYALQTPERKDDISRVVRKQLARPKRFNVAELTRELWLLFHRDAVKYDQGDLADTEDSLRHLFGGIPVDTASDRDLSVLHNLGYSVGYDDARKNPAWVAYRLFAVASDTTVGERPGQFNVDFRSTAQVRSEDYTGSGFDRGHLAPNYGIARCYGPAAQVQTFLMTNIAPQRHALNAGVWKEIEMREANDYAQNLEEIWIYCGTIFSPTRLRELPSGVPIPDSFYKIVIDEQHGALRVLAFIFSQNSNNKTAAADGLCSVDAIEAATGLDFFPELPEDIQAQLESVVPTSLW